MFNFIIHIECPALDEIPDGKLIVVNQFRADLYLQTDIFKYVCNEGYQFHTGMADNYALECLKNGLYNNSAVPICIKGFFSKVFKEDFALLLS